MNNVIRLVIEFCTKLQPIPSALLGIIGTVIIPISIERIKLRKTRLENVIIPYYNRIKNAYDIVEEILKNDVSLENHIIYDNLIGSLESPLEYLEFPNNRQLTASMRKNLSNYKELFFKFSSTIEAECDNCIHEYKNSLSDELQNFPILPGPSSVEISLDDAACIKVTLAIISKKKVSLIDNVWGVYFLSGNDFEHLNCTSVFLDKTSRTVPYDSEKDYENFHDELCCSVLNYIYENFSEEILYHHIAEAQCADMLNNIYDKLKKIQRKLERYINRIL